jgi:hypothetical protein
MKTKRIRENVNEVFKEREDKNITSLPAICGVAIPKLRRDKQSREISEREASFITEQPILFLRVCSEVYMMVA